MCIIKIVFNPLPMKIFWKKLALYIQFLKDKESALLDQKNISQKMSIKTNVFRLITKS